MTSFFTDLLTELEKDRGRDIKAFIENLDTETEDKGPMKAGERIRASSIWDFCPRREALRVKYNLTVRDEISGRLQRIFRFGRVFERYLRDIIFGDNKLLIGLWECAGCKTDAGPDLAGDTYRTKPETKCPKCGGMLWSYNEVQRIDQESMVGGSCDGFIKWNDDYALLEVKTANEWSFKAIKKANRPMQSHFAQAQVYMHLNGYKKTLFWYYNKNTSEQMTFWVEYDQAFCRAMLKKGSDFQSFANSDRKELPGRLCSDKRCPRAKECSLKELCFKEPA